jgi:hypothetical protein
MTTVTVTEQEKKVLNFVAKGERSARGDPYCSVNGIPDGYPPLVRMTVEQAIAYAESWRSDKRRSSSAIGRYQFLVRTLKGAVTSTGIDPKTTLFDSVTQDYLILDVLKKSTGLEQWKAGSLSDVKFLTKLAQVFASIPVAEVVARPDNPPVWAAATINPGESYYKGVGSNKAVGHDNLSLMLQELADIRNGGPGGTITGTIGVADPSLGVTTLAQTERLASGEQGITGGYATRQTNNNLPGVSNPYRYKIIDPLDNRYDFRTGEKVRDILINGVNPVSAAAYLANNGLTPINDIGVVPVDPSSVKSAVESKPVTGYGGRPEIPGVDKPLDDLAKKTVNPFPPPTETDRR